MVGGICFFVCFDFRLNKKAHDRTLHLQVLVVKRIRWRPVFGPWFLFWDLNIVFFEKKGEDIIETKGVEIGISGFCFGFQQKAFNKSFEILWSYRLPWKTVRATILKTVRFLLEDDANPYEKKKMKLGNQPD